MSRFPDDARDSVRQCSIRVALCAVAVFTFTVTPAAAQAAEHEPHTVVSATPVTILGAALGGGLIGGVVGALVANALWHNRSTPSAGASTHQPEPPHQQPPAQPRQSQHSPERNRQTARQQPNRQSADQSRQSDRSRDSPNQAE